MKIDVSEIKARRECGRKWAFSSRNFYHLTPCAPQPKLYFGTTFHEALASLYLSKGDPERVQEIILNAVQKLDDTDQQKQMACMLTGYAEEVLPNDLERYHVLDVEWHFKFTPEDYFNCTGNDEGLQLVDANEWMNDIDICGSIDLVLLDKVEGKIVGFEHKTCKNFRSEFYNSMDEQPRTYCIALDMYVEEYNARNNANYLNGGVLVNEVRKLKTRFEHNRLSPICSTRRQSYRFLVSFLRTAGQIHEASTKAIGLLEAEPGYLKCQLCDFRDACQKYAFDAPSKAEILDEFSEELKEREFDHLDEKVQQSGDE